MYEHASGCSAPSQTKHFGSTKACKSPHRRRHEVARLPRVIAVFAMSALTLLVVFQASSAGGSRRAEELAALASKAFESGDLVEAERALLQALDIDPGNPYYATALGEVYRTLGKADLAIAQLEKALRVLPGEFRIRYTLAQAYQNTDDDAKALEVLEGVQPPDSLRGPWTFTQGFSLFRLGRLEAAETKFQHLLRNDLMQGPANFFVANCHFARHQFAEALHYYDKAIALGNVPENRHYYDKAIALGNVPENRLLNVYWYNYGLAFYHLGRFRRCAGAFRESIQLHSHDPLPWLFLGRCEAESGNFKEAIAAFETLIKGDPDFSPAYFQLARLHVEYGDKQRAQELFQKVADLKKREVRQEQLSYQLKLTNK